MKTATNFPPVRKRRNRNAKSSHLPLGPGLSRHGHSHTRGELPGRLARNFKTIANAGSGGMPAHD